MDNQESQNIYAEEDDCVRIVALNEEQEAIMDNSMAQNTQCVLEVETASKKKKNTKGKTLVTTQKKTVMNNPLIQWLENFLQTEATLRVMKPFLKAINDAALKNKNMKLFNVGQTLQKIMKEFFIHMIKKRSGLNKLFLQYFRGVVLKRRIIHDVWEAPIDGLRERFVKSIIRPLQYSFNGTRRKAKSDGRSGGGEYSQNTKNTSTSFTTVHTQGQPVAVSTSKDYGIMSQMPATPKKSTAGQLPKSVTFQKEK